MKDLIEKILTYLPQYIADFGSLLSGPKRFIAEKNATAEDSFEKALLFSAISLVLVVVMFAPLRPAGKDLWTHVGGLAVTSLLAVSLYAVALRLAWRVVGGKATVKSFFVTYAYFFSALFVIFAGFLLLSEGVFKVLEPELHAAVLEAKASKQPMPDLSGTSVPTVSFLILITGYLLATVWGVVAWGSYRALNGLSKGRSFVAFIIMGLFGWIIGAIVFFVASVVT